MKIIQCEQCKGAYCGRCKGAGIAIVYDTETLFCGIKIDKAYLFLRQIRRILRTLVAIVLAAFGIIGIAALVLEAWPVISRLFTSAFWISPGRGRLIFSFSLLADLYLIMRVLRYGEKRKKVLPIPRKSGSKIEISSSFSNELMNALLSAYRNAARMKQNAVGLPQLFVGLLGANSSANILARLEIDPKGLKKSVMNIFDKNESNANPEFSNSVRQALIESYRDAQSAGNEYVQAYNVLFHAIQSDGKLKEIFFDLGVDEDKLKNITRWFEISHALENKWRRFRRSAAGRPKGSMNRAMTALQTRVLDRYSDDLTLLAGRGYLEMTVDREQEFQEIFRVLQGERKSILLVGPRGVGKEAILNGLAELMVEEQVPELLKDRRFISLSLPKIIAGATASEAEERLLACLADAARAGNIALAVPNAHEASAGRGAGGLDLAGVLADEMGKQYFLAVATTTPEEYREYIEGTAFDSASIKVNIKEPDADAAIHILESKIGTIEARNQVYFSYDALEKAVLLSSKYLKEQYLPEKAIDIIKETAQYARQKRGAKTMARGEDVAEIISGKSHVSVTTVTAAEADKLLNLEKVMHERIIGQDEAIKSVAAALRRARAGLREGKRPIANFLFLGPTGVGKTETAKTVAEVYFGNEQNMIRIDMSEYQDKAGVHRLLGAPGERGGLLTEPARKNPSALVLLDEIEKAHPDILNVFLQIMDDGRATDSAGRVVDFTNTIIIATSNAGTQFIQEAIKQNKTTEEIKKILLEQELKQYFKPEFLNRFDGVVVYKPLTEKEIISVAELMLAKVAEQLDKKGIVLRVTKEALIELAQAGYDPQFGARPLRRVIQERVDDALANLLLEKKISRRDVVILDQGGELRIEKAEKL